MDSIHIVKNYFDNLLTSDPSLCDRLPLSFYKKNSYEHLFNSLFGLQSSSTDQQRYWDSLLTICARGHRIELKKSSNGSYWLDEVRYAEIKMARSGDPSAISLSENAEVETITLFIRTMGKKIESISLIETDRLISECLQLSDEDARLLISRFQRIKTFGQGHSLNSQRKISLKLIEAAGAITIKLNSIATTSVSLPCSNIDRPDLSSSPDPDTPTSSTLMTSESSDPIPGSKGKRTSGSKKWPDACLECIEDYVIVNGKCIFNLKTFIELYQDKIRSLTGSTSNNLSRDIRKNIRGKLGEKIKIIDNETVEFIK